MRTKFRFIQIISIAVLIFGNMAFSQSEKVLRQAKESEEKKEKLTFEEKKIDPYIYDLLVEYEDSVKGNETQNSISQSPFRLTPFKYDSKKRVYLNITVSPEAINSDEIEILIIKDHGIVDKKVEYNGKVYQYFVFIHPETIRKLSIISSVIAIRQVHAAKTNTLKSKGDLQLMANASRAQLNVDGSGVKVGVISDGVDNINDVVQALELPSVTVLGNGGGNEGSAMLELVHDLAPGSQLYFSSQPNYTTQDFANSIRNLKLSGCKIIVDDLTWPFEPYFSDQDHLLFHGDMGSAIREFISNGGVYVTSAGNSAKELFSSSFSFNVNNFNVFADGKDYLEITIPANEDVHIYTQWATSWTAPNCDINMFAYSESEQQINLDGGQITQSTSNPPYESFSISNISSSDQKLRLRLKYITGSQSNGVDFKVLAIGGTIVNNNTNHIIGHHAYPNVISVAAYQADAETQIADYSSHGPAKMYSTATSNWTSQNVPTVTATAGVKTWVGTTINPQDPNGKTYWPSGYPVFSGTSASAPHIAAIAALYFDAFSETVPAKTNTNFIDDLKFSATSIGSGGTGGQYNNVSGWGKANALEAINRGMNRVATPQITPNGGNFTSAQNVTLYCATSGANIRYTLDESEPLSTSLQYSGTPINIPLNTTKTVKAKAFKTGMLASLTSTAFFTINPNAPPDGTLSLYRIFPYVKKHYVYTGGSPAYVDHTANSGYYAGRGTFISGAPANQEGRVFYHFDLGDGYIPNDAIVTKVILELSANSLPAGYPTIMVKQMIGANTDDGADCWSKSNSGATLITGINFSSSSYFWSNTYTSGNIITAVQNSLSNNYLQLAIISESPDNNKWLQIDPINGVRLTIEFTPPARTLTARNKLGTDYNYGQISIGGTWNNSPYSLPTTWGKTLLLEASAGKVSSPTNNWKYEKWINNNSTSNSQTYILTTTGNVDANFKKVFNLTVKNNLEGSEGGQLIYQGNPVNSGYTEEDIFEGYPKNVTSNATIVNGGTNFVFLNWSDGTTNPVHPTITVNSTQTLTANYKAHLASNTLQATSGGSTGRKIAVDNSGVVHAVYTSSEKIWYTKNTGSGWTNETYIGEGKNPSIDASNGVDIVWEQDLGDTRGIYFHNSVISSYGYWEVFTDGLDATPVVANGRPVWRDSEGLTVGTLPPNQGGQHLGGTIASSQSPSLAWNTAESRYCLAYQQGNGTYYREFINGSPTIIEVGSVVPLSGETGVANPSVIAYGSAYLIGVTWENTTDHKIYFKEKPQGGNWGNVQQLPLHNGHQMSKPSLGYSTNNGIHGAMIFFNCGSHVGMSQRLVSGGTWLPIVDFGIGTGANVSQNTSDFPSSAIWTNGSGPIFSITPTKFTQTTVPAGTITNLNWNGVVNVAGTATLNSGSTLNIAAGTVVIMTNGASLIANGKILAQGNSASNITFTSTGGTGYGTWGSIQINGSGAANSVLNNVNVDYGTEVQVVNAPNVTIQDCAITKTINGIRYTGSTTTGSILNSIVDTPRDHGIIIENGAHEVICHQNTAKKTDHSGAGFLFSAGSSGNIWRNDIQGWSWGVGISYGSSAYFKDIPGTQHTRNNRITDNTRGVYAYQSAFPVFSGPSYGFGYNSIYNNSYKNIYATTGGTMSAPNNYWGYPTVTNPQTTFYLTAGNTVPTSPELQNNPWQGISLLKTGNTEGGNTQQPISSTEIKQGNVSESNDSLFIGIKIREEKGRKAAKDYFKSYLAKRPDNQAAYVELYNCADEETVDDIIQYFSNLPAKAAKEHEMLLTYLYLRKGDISSAKTVNDKIIIRNKESVLGVRAKLNNFYIALYNENDIEKAIVLYKEVAAQAKFSTEMELELVRNALETYPGIDEEQRKKFGKEVIAKLAAPDHYELFQNYPNPFNPSTTINYALPKAGNALLKVYDVLGKEVATLVNDHKETGRYSVEFDASKLSSGMYIYKLTSDKFSEVKKMMLVK